MVESSTQNPSSTHIHLVDFRETDEIKIISDQKKIFGMSKVQFEVVLSDLIQDDQFKMPIHNWTRIA